MYQIVLTGGIGAGKSVVAQLLSKHGAYVIDYDQIARDVVEPDQPAFKEIVEHWGDDVLNADGTLNRCELASRVFEDISQLEQLNAVTHPYIMARAADRAEKIMRDDPSGILVHDIPVISVDSPMIHHADLVVVVQAPLEVRIDRLAQNRGMTIEDAQARIAHQIDDSEREKMADIIVHNDGTIRNLERQVDRLWKRIGDWEENS